MPTSEIDSTHTSRPVIIFFIETPSYSNGPHLHFVVYADENSRTSIPVRFGLRDCVADRSPGFTVPDGDPGATLAYLQRLRTYAVGRR